MRNYRIENKVELLRINKEKELNPKKPKKQKTKEQEKRGLIIKGIAAVLALIIAAVAFSIVVKQCTAQEEGWQMVDADLDADGALYSSGISLNYYFIGTSNEIRAAKNEVKSAYSKALAHIYKLLDPYNEYEGYVNLAYINSHPGEDITVPYELRSVLASAKELTDEGLADVFGGCLYNEWRSISVLDESKDFDPLVNPDESERIDELARMTARRELFTLELKENNVIRFEVAQEYLEMCERLETEPEILNLGFLREAYEVEYTASQLEDSGFKRGYITTDTGVTRFMSNAYKSWLAAYTISLGTKSLSAEAFRLPTEGRLMCCVLRSFALDETDIEYYTVTTDSGTVLRHPHYVLSTGEVNSEFLTVAVTAEEGSLARVCAEAYRLICSDTAAAPSLAEGLHAAYILTREPTLIHADEGFAELIPADGMSVTR